MSAAPLLPWAIVKKEVKFWLLTAHAWPGKYIVERNGLCCELFGTKIGYKFDVSLVCECTVLVRLVHTLPPYCHVW